MHPYWTKLVGHPDAFNIDNRAFNGISIISIMVLLLLLPVNLFLRLPYVSLSVLVTAALLLILYYFSRFRRQYEYSMLIYAIGSYVLLSITFFLNGGADGPSLLLFLLSFQLLIAFTPKSRHPIWVMTHIVVTASLLLIQYHYPERILGKYQSPAYRILDLSTTALVVLACMYYITVYLRSNYNRERQQVEEHAAKIEEQNLRIREQYSELEKLSLEKTKLISVLGQDLRGPLNAIASVLELLTSYPVPEQRARELQKGLLQTTRNTSDVLSNLLLWTSRQMKGITVELQRIRLLEIMQKLVTGQQNLAEQKSITLSVDISEDIYLLADANLLELALRNVLNNALKFTGDKGLVEVIAEVGEHTAAIKVIDNGIGMMPEQMDQLFSLNIHSTVGTNNEKGIGLGLVLTKEFIEAQGGTISAESREGFGSTFTIRMPLYRGVR